MPKRKGMPIDEPAPHKEEQMVSIQEERDLQRMNKTLEEGGHSKTAGVEDLPSGSDEED